MFPTLLPSYQRLNDFPSEWRKLFQFYRYFAGNPNPLKHEGFYYRLIYSPEHHEHCLQVVLYYRVQILPYHPNDFHPFYLYLDKMYRPLRLLFDEGHHRGSLAQDSSPWQLTVRFPWHGYKLGRERFALPLDIENFHLSDQVLRDWWMQLGKAQFKLRSKFVNPWHQSLLKLQKIDEISFRDEVVCPICESIQLLDKMNLENNIFRLPLTCRNGHRFVAAYDPLKMEMTCFR